jgi:hypothetical protein
MPFNPIITTNDVLAVARIKSDDLSVHIATVGIYMDSVFEADSLPDDLYRLIGIYLAGHFALISKGGEIKTDKVDVLSTSFNMTSGLGLKATTLGQQAISLDSTGTLAELDSNTKGKPRKASICMI